jgi:cytidylate kinase
LFSGTRTNIKDYLLKRKDAHMSVIAISRGSLYATKKLAEGLKQRLGYAIISREEVIDAAKRYGIEETGLGEKDIMELHPPGYWHERANERMHYLTCFKTALLDFALQGSIIYHGNLAHVLLNDVPLVLRVRINAPIENRVKLLMNEMGIPREKAIEKIKDMDYKRRLWVQFLYDAEVFNPIFFDLVLNLERISIDDAIELVVNEVKKEQFQPTQESMKTLRDIHLAGVVKANLMSSPKTKAMDIEVIADSSISKIVISGNIPSGYNSTLENDIRSILSGIAIIKELEIRLN